MAVSIWTILNSGSRGSLIGIFVGLIFAISILINKRKDLRKYLYGSLVLLGSLVLTFITLTILIESQRNDLKNNVVKNYIPEVLTGNEVSFSFNNYGGGNGYDENNEINNILSQLNFLKTFQEVERSSGSNLDMKSLSELIEVNNYYTSENDIYCSDEMLLYYWATNRYSFRECTQ